MTDNLSILLAFAAGLLSFLSPCVLPLIPSYLCVIGGAPELSKMDGEFKPRLVMRTFSFILGFSAVFIALSVVLAVTFNLMGGFSRWINWISGGLVIVLGFNVIFDFLAFLNYEKRMNLQGAPRGMIGAFLAGGAFGAGWTPCVGPVLAGILLLAAQSGGIPKAVLYLAFYSAGLGLPFLLSSAFFNAFVCTSAKLRSHLPLIRRISGALLIVIGVLIVTGRFQALSAMTAKWQNSLSAKVGARADNASASSGSTGSRMTLASAAGGDSTAQDNAVPPEVISAFRAARLPVTAKAAAPVDFTLPLLDGTQCRLSGLQGKVVFLNFWATWCPPCRAEMPSMEAVYQQLRDSGFEILAVNIREGAANVSAFMKENKLSFPVALDESGKISGLYGVQAIPTSYIIDKRGLIVSRLTGSINWNEPRIIAALQSLL
jgi:cytochrome c-type biogenesis protein